MGKDTESLSIYRACIDALRGKTTAYYPRKVDGRLIESKDIFSEVTAVLNDKKLPSTDAEKYVDLAKSSLEEVKGLTEYQDQKIARLLTIIAFLTAAAGVVLSKFIDLYPPSKLFGDLLPWPWACLVLGAYATFVFFLLCVACGALVAFHASQTRFVWDSPAIAQEKSPKSYLFYRGIIGSTPEYWAKSFCADQTSLSPTSATAAPVPSELRPPQRLFGGLARIFSREVCASTETPPAPPVQPSSMLSIEELQTKYFRNYVAETYLVAAKVSDKVRYLEPAQRLLSGAIKALIVLLLFVVASVLFVHPVPINAHTESTVTMSVPSAPGGSGDAAKKNEAQRH